MFELAAFLHSHDTYTSKSLVVCPIFVGPALLIAHMGLCIVVLGFVCSQVGIFPWGTLMVCSLTFPCLTLLAYVVLAHCRSIIVMQQQLSQFGIEHAKSQCCDCGHVHKYTGDKMICDRNIILRCISSWFGSTEQFESLVQDRLLKTLVHHLTNEVFSYFRIVQATSPVGWVCIDVFLGGWIRHEFDVRGLVLISSAVVGYWLMVLPCIVFFLLRLASKAHAIAALCRVGRSSRAHVCLLRGSRVVHVDPLLARLRASSICNASHSSFHGGTYFCAVAMCAPCQNIRSLKGWLHT